MCTVVYIPSKEKKYFASLRDEDPKRQRALPPASMVRQGVQLLMPQDAEGGGTWMGANSNGSVIILLNGGFTKHTPADHYIMSRGLVVFDLLQSCMPVIEWNLISLLGVAPFTLVVWSDESLFELVWDGAKRYRRRLDDKKPHIWSSCTLYDSEASEIRAETFANWIAMDPPVDKLHLFEFFKSYNDKTNGFFINRDEVIKTLSYTFLELVPEQHANMNYYDLQSYTYSKQSLVMRKHAPVCIGMQHDNPEHLRF